MIFLQLPWTVRSVQRRLGADFYTLLTQPRVSKRKLAKVRPKAALATTAATIIDGMRPESIGRALGIGLRVAGRMASQRMAGGAETAASAPAGQKEHTGQTPGRPAGQTAKGVARGVGGFLRPFSRLGAILWLEMTGAFFLLFALVSASFLWKNRASYAFGPEHRGFVASAAMMVVFLYLGISSFWRARKR
jgi:hypothetical protein